MRCLIAGIGASAGGLQALKATEGYVLTVTDDGTGLPADFDPASTPGFGMKVLSALAGQLGGELRFGGATSVSGANFSIHVAEIPPARNI